MTEATTNIERLESRATPEELFEQIALLDGAFFLDSAMYNEQFGRYSFFGIEPIVTITARGNQITIDEKGERNEFQSCPFEALRGLIDKHSDYFAQVSKSTLPFVGGLVGYFGYGLRHFIEKLPDSGKHDQRFPDMYFGLYDCALCFDAMEKQWHLASTMQSKNGTAKKLRALLEQAGSAPLQNATGEPTIEPLKSNFTREQYIQAVQRTKDYIAAGDIFQANISQRFETNCSIAPLQLYRRLRNANPAPFAAYVRLDDDRHVMSSSPERYLGVAGREVETRPIKGTRPRRIDHAEDEAMKRELLASEKDNAELAMIIDLERNDLGRVCKFGSIEVTEARVIETYESVHHLVSTVKGKLCAEEDIISLLKASFPGGSITGAPKIRAMEIIDELESTARSVYTGSIGFIGLGGVVDLNIAIRTMLYDAGRVTFQVGGGIVADSDPEMEFDETIHKAGGIIKALQHP